MLKRVHTTSTLGDRTRWARGGGWEKKKARYHNPTEGIKVCKTAKHAFASLHDLSDSTVKPNVVKAEDGSPSGFLLSPGSLCFHTRARSKHTPSKNIWRRPHIRAQQQVLLPQTPKTRHIVHKCGQRGTSSNMCTKLAKLFKESSQFPFPNFFSSSSFLPMH